MSDHAAATLARRAAITSQIQAKTGIDEAMVERLVRSFYARARDDAILGPIFAAKIRDWEPHLQKMFAFWSSVALMSGRYHGQPMARIFRYRSRLGTSTDGWLCSPRRRTMSVRPRQRSVSSFCHVALLKVLN